MKHIAVLIGKMFEDVEYIKPAESFRTAGHKLTHIGIREGETVRGKSENTPVRVDKAAKKAKAEDYDALFIPGGYSPDYLRADDDVVHFTRQFMESKKPVFAICHGPQLLISAEVLRGRVLTGYKSITQDIKNAGADFVDREVVEDRNLITSRNPGDIPVFISAAMKKLK
jgi:protease I